MSDHNKTPDAATLPALFVATRSVAPKWLLKREGITQRQWRARKRADLKNLVAAFGRYRTGCAYCPGKDGEVGTIQNALNALTKSHSAKAWK